MRALDAGIDSSDKKLNAKGLVRRIVAAFGSANDRKLPLDHQLAKFVLLRWDQIDELVEHIERCAPAGSIDVGDQLLSNALARVADHRLGQLDTYRDFISDSKQARRDFKRKPVFLVRNFPEDAQLPPHASRVDKKVWLKCESGRRPTRIGEYEVMATEELGVVELNKVHPA